MKPSVHLSGPMMRLSCSDASASRVCAIADRGELVGLLPYRLRHAARKLVPLGRLAELGLVPLPAAATGGVVVSAAGRICVAVQAAHFGSTRIWCVVLVDGDKISGLSAKIILRFALI